MQNNHRTPAKASHPNTLAGFFVHCSIPGDLQELRHGQSAASFATQHCALGWQQPHPAPNTCTPAWQQPHLAEIRRWRRQSVQMGRQICVCLSSSPRWQQGKMRTYIFRCGIGRIPMLRVSKSGPGVPDC